MRTKEELKQRLSQYKGVDFIYDEHIGYIVWQVSTGENVEILFIEAKEKRRGFGRMLLEGMTRCIKPYHSVFVYRLASNEVAGEFYRSFGFKETKINGLYGGDDAIINVISYEELCQNLLIK